MLQRQIGIKQVSKLLTKKKIQHKNYDLTTKINSLTKVIKIEELTKSIK